MIAFTSQGRLVKAPIHRSSHIQDHQGHAHNQVIVKRMSCHQLSSNIYEKSIRESNDFTYSKKQDNILDTDEIMSFAKLVRICEGCTSRFDGKVLCSGQALGNSPKYEDAQSEPRNRCGRSSFELCVWFVKADFRWNDLDSAHLTIKCTRLWR